MAKIISISPKPEWTPDPDLMASLYQTDLKRWERKKEEHRKRQLLKIKQQRTKKAI
jgi:hypothetical protein